eukprot:IDg7829t1
MNGATGLYVGPSTCIRVPTMTARLPLYQVTLGRLFKLSPFWVVLKLPAIRVFGTLQRPGFPFSSTGPEVKRSKFPRNFCFLRHGRVGRLHEHDAHATHNEHICETAYFMDRYKILCNYHNTEADLLTDVEITALYSSMSPFWMINLSYKYSSLYPSMPPSLTYLAEHLVDNKPHTNLSWAITVTERVALIAVEWYRQVYVQFNMWKFNSWMYEQFERLDGKLACVFGNKRNCDDFFALLKKVYRLCPLW